MKKWQFNMILLPLLFTASGCGMNRQTASMEMLETETQAEERENLVLWSYYETRAQKEGLDYLVEEFNKSQQQYELSWEYIPMQDYVKKLSSVVSENDLPDLILLDNPDMPSLIHSGFLEDITEQIPEKVMQDKYYPKVFDTVRSGDKIYGIPFSCNNTAIIYNKDMFDEAGLQEPETWEEFENAARTLTTQGEDGHYGFAMSAAAGEQGAFQFMPWLLATGVDTQHMEDECTREAFELIDGMLADGTMPHECLNYSQNDLTRMFLDGKAAMIENGPWAVPKLEESGIDYGICPFPEHTKRGIILGGENLALIKGKNVSGGIEVINFCSRPEIIEHIGELTGNISPVIDNAERFKQFYPQYGVFVDQMGYGISRSDIPDWKKVCQALCDSLYQLFGSEHTTDQVFDAYVLTISGQ